jgi:hypothetical protein
VGAVDLFGCDFAADLFAGALAVRFGCGFAVWRAEVLLEGLAALRAGALDFFRGAARLALFAEDLFAADLPAADLFVADLLADGRALLDAEVPAFVALRTGSFFAVGRLAIGFGRAVFVLNLRLFADAAGEALRVCGREAGLLTPLMTGSLMRSYSVIKMTQRRSQNGRSLTQPARINQRITLVCGRVGVSVQICQSATEKNSCGTRNRCVRFR